MPPPRVLGGDDLGVRGARREQFVVRAGADDPAVLEHEDLIGVADRRHALGDDHDRGLVDARRQRRSQASIGREVERREGVVEHVDVGLHDQRTGDRQPLALAARHVRASLGDLALDAVRHRLHEAARLSDLERVPELRLGGVRPSEAQVGSDRSGEQVGALRHVADLCPTAVPARAGGRRLRSTSTAPSVTSNRRVMRLTIVVLPAPVLPMIAVVSPGADSERDVVEHRMTGAGVGERDVDGTRSCPARSTSVTGDSGGRTDDSVSSTSTTRSAATDARGIIDSMNVTITTDIRICSRYDR